MGSAAPLPAVPSFRDASDDMTFHGNEEKNRKAKRQKKGATKTMYRPHVRSRQGLPWLIEFIARNLDPMQAIEPFAKGIQVWLRGWISDDGEPWSQQ